MAIMLPSTPKPTSNGHNTTNRNTRSESQQDNQTIVEEAIKEVVAEKLDVAELSSACNSFKIVDMGCSVGPKNFNSVQIIIEAVGKKLASQGITADQFPEFQVYFNDHIYNDFNTLYDSLPPQRNYFFAGLPGSFYGRLLPKSSLHFVHCAYALQWLSELPEEVTDKSSPSWNKGRVHYTNSSEAVVTAYATQFAKDMGLFLDARAAELVAGGMMVIVIPSVPDGVPCSNTPNGILFNHLESCLLDIAKKRLVSEELVNTFNIPMYVPTPKEMKELIARNGSFTLERIGATGCTARPENRPLGHTIVNICRRGMGGIIGKHFGEEIIDELFCRMLDDMDSVINKLSSSRNEGGQLTLVLKRKCHI